MIQTHTTNNLTFQSTLAMLENEHALKLISANVLSHKTV